jgi:hypothetical protein
MARCLGVGLILPAALSWAVVALGATIELMAAPVNDGQGVIVAVCVVAVPLSLLVSSSVDWYLIRAFREGVYGDPACRDSDSEGTYLRYWAMHRFLCEFFIWLAVTGGIAFVSAIVEGATSSPSGKTTLGLIGLLGIIGWSAKELGKLRPAYEFIRYPNGVGLGSWATGRNEKHDRIEGFVLDLALDPGVQLIRGARGHPAPDISIREQCVPLANRDTLSAIDPPRPLCAKGCEFWVPDCEVGLRERREAENRIGAPAA